jgi:curved DNA-binding protein CbpA
MEGLLGKHPAAELIREIAATATWGALRLARERAKAAIYFEDGHLVFASSNLRAHRLYEVLKRRGLADAERNESLLKLPDAELGNALIQSGRLTADTLTEIRADQVSDVLRAVLLWTDGTWEFDPRVRLADESRVQIDLSRLLLECARHLPASFISSRFVETNGTYLTVVSNFDVTRLLPAEVFVLTRATSAVSLGELIALSEMNEEEGFRAIYAVSLAGHLQRSDWPVVLGAGSGSTARKVTAAREVSSTPAQPTAAADAEEVDARAVEALFARLADTKDYYEVLDVVRTASTEEIKSAYHTLARRFHPDHFHKSDPGLRRRIDSAFARIAKAYETLSNESMRASYDSRHASQARAAKRQESATAPAPQSSNGGGQASQTSEAVRAKTSFQRGMDATRQNRHDEAIRHLAEAAKLAPREARYRAYYGRALIKQSNMRRVAEGELQAALSLDPENTSYRVMLAELYKEVGLRRRAEGELERALIADPRNEAARTLLLSLKSK